jgi:TonB family protein
MFGTLLASNTAGLPVTRPAFAAGLLHLLIVIVAVRLTASTPPVLPSTPRDTIALELALPPAPTPSDGSNRPSAPLVPAPLPPVAEPSPPPRLELASPYRAADWRGLTGVDAASQALEAVRPGDSAGPRFSTADVDQLPELRGPLNPSYPGRLRRAGISGSVQLQYRVLPSGRADSASVLVIASTEPGFTTSVISAVLSARFRPARRQGRPVAVLVQQTFRFQNR